MARTRDRRLLTATGLTAALVTGAALVPGPMSAAQAADLPSVTVRPDPSYRQQPFEGWGTSLVWFANATGDYPPQIREKLARLVFGDEGLALNIARYNIGGGNAPTSRTTCGPAGPSRAGGRRPPAPPARTPAGGTRTIRPTGTTGPTPPSAGGSTGSRRTSPTGRPSATPRPGS